MKITKEQLKQLIKEELEARKSGGGSPGRSEDPCEQYVNDMIEVGKLGLRFNAGESGIEHQYEALLGKAMAYLKNKDFVVGCDEKLVARMKADKTLAPRAAAHAKKTGVNFE